MFKKFKLIINQGDERNKNVIKNIFASFGIKGVSICVQLLLIPITINYVNATQYGIWLTLSSIIGWFSFFDIGFANGLRNRFAEAKATGDYNKANIYISTTYICVGLIFTIGWVLFFFINFFLDWSKILNAPEKMAKELSIVALIVLSFFSLQMILKLINTILIADQKPAKSAFLDMLGQLLALFIIFVLTKTTKGSLIYLAFALGFCPAIIMLISNFWFYTYDYKIYRPSIKSFKRDGIKDIMVLSGKFFFIQVGAIIIFQTNNIVITQICGPNSVTVYNIAYKYFSIVQMIFMIILTPFWSVFTDAYIKRDFKWMRQVVKKIELIWIILFFLSILLLCISSFAYKIWVKKSINIPFLISLLVCVYILINMRYSIYIYLINGIGKIKLQFYFNIVLCILNIPIIVLLGYKFGLEGIILGNILISLPHMIYSPIQLNKLLKNKAVGIWGK